MRRLCVYPLWTCRPQTVLTNRSPPASLKNRIPKIRPLTGRNVRKVDGLFLSPKSKEEIRKREERKDRLHQNYLKRKASGAQKRYEDKIKGRKKAEIEAKKAAIRAEDIAKGVFVPVSSLPQREPMKGVQTA